MWEILKKIHGGLIFIFLLIKIQDIIGVFVSISKCVGNRHIDQNSPNIIHVCPIDKIEYPVKTNSRVDCKDDISVIKEIIRIIIYIINNMSIQLLDNTIISNNKYCNIDDLKYIIFK